MKKNFTLIVALFSLITSTFGQVLLDETFDYTVSNLASAPGWTTSGTLVGGTGRNILDPTVTPALTYSNSGGTYYLSGSGRIMNSDITSATAYYSLKPFTATPVSTGPIYLTFMYKAGVAQNQTNSEVFGMSTGSNAGPKVYVGKGIVTTTSFRFGTTRSSQSSADVKWATSEFADVNEVFLIVLKYDFTTQISSIYINPTISGTEPTADITDNSGTARTSLNNLWVRAQGTSSMKYNIGGARVSRTWAEAVFTQIPKLSSPVVGIATSISLTGFTANWTQVPDATGYTVKVYSGATLVNTTNASGQATESVAISGLASGTTYTYKVTAVGNGTTFSSSDPSAASDAFITLGLTQPTVGVATDITSTGFTANWTAVANATGYDVKVYLGTLLIATTNAPGQATSSLAITGLSFGTSYTFVIIAKGDGATYLDSSPSTASPVFITSYMNVNTIYTDFGDGTWGAPASATPGNGFFPSSSINGFVMEKSVIRAITKRDRRGFSHVNDIALDNLSNAGTVVFPVVDSVKQIELHAYTGTAERPFTVEEYNSGTSAWVLVGNYIYNTASKAAGYDSIYIIPITRTVPTKFRVRNTGGGGMNIAQVITRHTNPETLPSPVVGTATDITHIGFTANWTPVTNATGYKVFVYKLTNLVDTSSVSGQAISSVAITGLIPDSTYTYKVLAKGDGFVNYSDSYQSAASAPFTLLTPPVKTLNLTVFLESLYAGSNTMNQAQKSLAAQFAEGIADQVSIELHNSTDPYETAYSFNAIDLSTVGTLSINTISYLASGSYYIVIKHRNSVELWSSVPVSFAGTTMDYNFSTSVSQAFGSNMKDLGSGVFGMYAGDVNQDGIVDAGDLVVVDNDASNFVTGYVANDVNGDGMVNETDLQLINANATGFAGKSKP
jgi:hypothetical protein